MKADQDLGRRRLWGWGAVAALGLVGGWLWLAGNARGQTGQSPDGSATPSPVRPEGARTVEEIVALVGDKAILRSEVEEQAQALAEQLQVDPADSVAYGNLHRDVLNRLIDDQVLLKEAEAQNIKVSPEEIEQSVEEAVQNNIRQLGGPEAFAEQLKKEGLTEVDLRMRYREEARKQILASRMVQKEVRPRVNVPPDAARKFFDENRAQLPKKPRALRIQDCFIRTRPDSVLLRRAYERALEVRQKIVEGMPFSEAASKFSDDPRVKESDALGRFSKGDLEPELETPAFALNVGELSQPVLSHFGYHLLMLTDKDPAGEWIEASHILLAATPTRSDEERAREKAERVYAEVTSGQTDLVDAIHRYSDDAEVKAQDGDLGWIPIDSFFGEMKTVADTLRVGRLSHPVAGDGGYHVFRVQGEQAAGPYSFDEVEEQMKQYAAQAAMEKELRAWLDELRKKYFVEIRASW